MATPRDDESLLKRYLLGRMAAETREEVEARVFSDDQVFWERLCLVEDELVDDYVRGALDAGEIADFEERFLCTDERRGKVEFARALRAHVERLHARGESGWRRLRSPVAVPAWAVAASALILLAGLGAIWRSAPRDPGAAAIVAVTLSPGLVRAAGGELERVRLRPDSRLVELRLSAGSERYASYRATLHDVNGDELWSQARLAPASTDAGSAVILTLPAELLPEGDYFIRLHAISAAEDPVQLHRYDFRVLRD